MQSTWFCEQDVWIPWQREELRLTSLETAGGAQITAEARAGGRPWEARGLATSSCQIPSLGWMLHSGSPSTPAQISDCLPGPGLSPLCPIASTVSTAISLRASFDCIIPLLKPHKE